MINDKQIEEYTQKYFTDYKDNEVNVVEYEHDWLIIGNKNNFIITEENPGPAGARAKVLVIPKNNGIEFLLGHFSFSSKEDGVDGIYDIFFKKKVIKALKLAKFTFNWIGEGQFSSIELMKLIKSDSRTIPDCFIRKPLAFIRELSKLGVEVKLYRQNNTGGYF